MQLMDKSSSCGLRRKGHGAAEQAILLLHSMSGTHGRSLPAAPCPPLAPCSVRRPALQRYGLQSACSLNATLLSLFLVLPLSPALRLQCA